LCFIFASDVKIVEKINVSSWENEQPATKRQLFLLGLGAKELTKIILNISENRLIIPVRLWASRLGILGSKFGFGSIKGCFEKVFKTYLRRRSWTVGQSINEVAPVCLK